MTIVGIEWPLSVGNEWVYQSTDGSERIVRVSQAVGDGWFRVEGLFDGDLELRRDGVARRARAGVQATRRTALFRFSQAPNVLYRVTLEPFFKIAACKVAAVGTTVKTPVGTFKGCMRIDVVSNAGSAPHQSFWFAPGIGLVQYNASGKLHRLIRVHIDDGPPPK
jgi:hypothetical protein